MTNKFIPPKNFASMLVKFLSLILLILVSPCIKAQQKVIQLYNGTAPGSENWTWKENVTNKNAFDTTTVYNVSHPTLTVFFPDSAVANGTAIIICPGGGFHLLTVDFEGSRIAKWLNKKGITAFLLKYRLVHSLTDDPWKEMMDKFNDRKKFDEENAPVVKLAVQDVCTAIAYVREHAAEFGIDKNRIGVIGFSAGGALAASMAYNYIPETRPDFVAAIYAGTNLVEKTNVPEDAPPMFIAAATDDQVVPVSCSVGLYNDWMTSKHSAELHLYSQGNHGLWGLPANTWIDRFGEWMDIQGLLKPKKRIP